MDAVASTVASSASGDTKINPGGTEWLLRGLDPYYFAYATCLNDRISANQPERLHDAAKGAVIEYRAIYRQLSIIRPPARKNGARYLIITAEG